VGKVIKWIIKEIKEYKTLDKELKDLKQRIKKWDGEKWVKP